MTISFKTGDVLNETGVIVHGCNAQGVMGSGIALAVKNRFPAAYEAYKHQDTLQLGQIIVVKIDDDKYIINAITQEYFGKDENKRYVSYDAIDIAFKSINQWMLKNSLFDLKFPAIGAGFGNGNWAIIESIIESNIDEKIEKTLFVL